jgi:DNA repair exonuclease SbcCD ATPase subunit
LKNEVKKKIENIEKRLNEEDIKKESINKEIDETQSKLDDLNNEKKTQINEQRARSIKNIEIIETKILPITNNLEKANKRKQEINIKIDKVNSIIKTYQDRINTLSNQEKKDLIDTKQFESEIEKYSNLIKESEYKKETIDQMIKILSDKGIKSYIVSKYVPIINELVNKYLEIFSANYRLTFDEQFDLSIHARGYEKLGYDSFSSGECQRVDMSLLFAFMELGRLKNSINTNCVFYDEITDMSMDASGIDGFVNIINSMKREGKTIFNISHRPELQDRFDKSFRVNKNMFSSLEEI